MNTSRNPELAGAPAPTQVDRPESIGGRAFCCQRDVRLEGLDAIRWLADKGVANDDAAAGIRVAGDYLEIDQFTVARIWNTSSTLRFDRMEIPGRSFVALQCIEGSLTVGAGGFERALDSGEIVVLDSAIDISITARRSVGWMLIRSPWDRLVGYREVAFPMIYRRQHNGQILASLLNSVLSSTILPTDVAFPALRLSVEAVLTGLLASEYRPPTSASRIEADILSRAMRYIDERASDPLFSTTELHSRLAVSRSYLYRAFSRSATTPRGYLLQRRVALARAAMAESAAVASGDLDRVVRASGFLDARALRRALQVAPKTPSKHS